LDDVVRRQVGVAAVGSDGVAFAELGNLDDRKREVVAGRILLEGEVVQVVGGLVEAADFPAYRRVAEGRLFQVLGEEGGGWVEGGGGWPSSLARTGSKSTNQLWDSARVIASSVAFIHRFNSILSSSAPSTAAMAFCSGRGGRLNSNASIRTGAVWRIFVSDALTHRSRLKSDQSER